MVTKSRLKLIKSLSRKKNRDEHQLFIVEGYKSIQELAQSSLKVKEILVTDGNHHLDHLNPEVIPNKEMNLISNLKTPPGYLAVFEYPDQKNIPTDELLLALDNIKDPGNLGTIIRMCDWFNIKHVICNLETVDVFNPKCVQASMASLGRVLCHYVDLKQFLHETDIPVFTTTMDGASVYDTKLESPAIVVMGNESAGISKEIIELGQQVSIPRYGSSSETESLNVATATAILIAEWRRSTGM